MLDPEDKPEAARHAFELLRPDLDEDRVDQVAFNLLSAGGMTSDRAISLWTEKWRLHLLQARLRNEIDGR